MAGADAGFRVRGGAPVAYPGFQREGCLRSGPIRKVGGGGASGPIYEKWEGGRRFRSDIRKVGGGGGEALLVRYTKSGGGGGGGHSAASGPIPLDTQKISTCTYLGILHTRARMNMPAKVNLL